MRSFWVWGFGMINNITNFALQFNNNTMKKSLQILIVFAFLGLSAIAQPGTISNASNSIISHNEKNGNHTLGLFFDTTACGLNYTHATVLIETRYNQYAISALGSGFPAQLSLEQLPATYTIDKAFLYWQESYYLDSANPLYLTNPIGNHFTIAGTIAGSDGPECWGEQGTRTYRADVTNVITGIGSYTIDSIGGSLYNNNAREVDGATLIVIYQDLNAAYEGTFIIQDGAFAAIAGNINFVISNLNICQTQSSGKGFILVAGFEDTVSSYHTAVINSDTIDFPNLFLNFDEDTVTYHIGQTTLVNGERSISNCYLISAIGAYYQDTCTTCNAIPSCSSNFTLIPDTNIQHHYFAINNATGTPPLNYLWSWGDSTYDTTAFPSHTYADSGIYTICLTITDSTGCTSNYCDTTFLQRTANYMVYVNVISPTHTGIQGIPSTNKVFVYPNPANNTLNIHSQLSILHSQLIITDLLGTEVYKEMLTGIDNTISISTWSAGLYFYEVRSNNSSIRGKFVKEL